MKYKILSDIERKLISHFTFNDRKYSIYKLNEITYNFIDENETKIKKRFKKFKSINEIFEYLGIEG